MELFKREGKKINVSPRAYAWAISIGLVLFCVHNEALTYTNAKGETPMFLPWIGFAIILMSLFMLFNKKDFKFDFGSKFIWIPMLVIVGSVVISSFANGFELMKTAASTLFILTLFMLYAASRALGKDILIVFAPAVVIEAISCVVLGITNTGVRNGGIISITNYDIATGLLVFGTLVSAMNKQWWLSAIAITGLFFTGAEEGIFCLGILGLALLIKRDWGKKLLVPAGVLVVLLIVCTPLGITQQLYSRTPAMVSSAGEAIITNPAGEEWIEKIDVALAYKPSEEYIPAIKNFKFFGHGYNINSFYVGIPHNVPLVILDQIGILAMLAWLWIMGYCLVKTKWQYAIVGLLALSTFDHFIWTQVAPWWWVMIGVASASRFKRDYIFKEV